MQSPFPAGWWSFDLGKYRPCDGTYRLFDYGDLPPLEVSLFAGTFNNWLTPAARVRRGRRQGLAGLETAMLAVGVRLPSAFLAFMGDPALKGAVPSCTACEWDPSAAPVPCRVVPGAYTVRFLRDQQDCLLWYLHLLPDGDVHVICSPIPFDDPELEVSKAVVIANTWYCAPHFEHFVYRFWIENEIWDRLATKGSTLTPAMAAYVEHYAALAAGKQPAAAAKRQAAAKRAAATKAAKGTAKAAAKRAAATKVAKGTAKAAATKAAATKVAKGTAKAAATKAAATKAARKAAK